MNRHAGWLCFSLVCLPVSARGQTQQTPTFELTLERCPGAFAFPLDTPFLGTACPGCRDAGDLNDDGAMDISDAIYGLNFLFSGAPPPPHPGPEACGSDPTLDPLPDCAYSRC